MVIFLLDTSFLTKNLIAHRGVCYNYRENTIEAFCEAIKNNYIIELDVRLTKDNKVVVFHDSNLFRIVGINKNISDLSYLELEEIIKVPTLIEVLKFVKGRVPIIIEIKNSSIKSKIEKYVSNILDDYKYKFAIQSFNPLTIFWFKLNRPKFVRGYLINSIFSIKFIATCLLDSKLLKPNYMGVNLKSLKDKKIIKLRCKYLVVGYTINNNIEYNKYKKYADNFICNIGKEPYK